MTYKDIILPDGTCITKLLQSEFRMLGNMANTYGCCIQHGEPMFFDYEDVRDKFLQKCAELMSVWHVFEITKEIARFEEVATRHSPDSGLCRYNTEVPAQLDPRFEESGLNADLHRILI